MEVFGSIHCFLFVISLHYISTTLYAASSTLPRSTNPPTNITFNLSMSLNQTRKEAVLNHVLFLLLTPCTFLYSFFVSQKSLHWLTNQSPTCPKNLNPGLLQHLTSTVVFLVPFLVQFEHIYSCDGILSMWINKASSCGMVYSFCHPCWKHDVYN